MNVHENMLPPDVPPTLESDLSDNECYTEDSVQANRWAPVRMQVGLILTVAAAAASYASTSWLMEQRRGHRFDLGDRSWQGQANCIGVNPDLFFPEAGASIREARDVCKGCVVREECLEYALVNGEKFGIWGGLSERERRPIRRARTLARQQSRSDLPS
jgi:WhiB family redox-sensing transcriptional regulator